MGSGSGQTASGLEDVIVRWLGSLGRLISGHNDRGRPVGRTGRQGGLRAPLTPQAGRRPVKGVGREGPAGWPGVAWPRTGGKATSRGAGIAGLRSGVGVWGRSKQGHPRSAACTQTLPQIPCSVFSLCCRALGGVLFSSPSLDSRLGPLSFSPAFSAPRALVEATLPSACAAGFPGSPCLTTLFWGAGTLFPIAVLPPSSGGGGCPTQGAGCEDRSPAALGRGWTADR